MHLFIISCLYISFARLWCFLSQYFCCLHMLLFLLVTSCQCCLSICPNYLETLLSIIYYITVVWYISAYLHFSCNFKQGCLSYGTFARGHIHTQVATGNFQWMFLGGCLNYVDVFFEKIWNKKKLITTLYHFTLSSKSPNLNLWAKGKC